MTTIDTLNLARRHGVSPSALHVLLAIIEDAPVRPIDLSTRVGVSPGAMTGLLDTLERGGWISREDNHRDRRSTIIAPTERAREVFENAKEHPTT